MKPQWNLKNGQKFMAYDQINQNIREIEPNTTTFVN
jgi:hypothetical protein